MPSILIKNGLLINENQQFIADIYIENGFIAEISKNGISRSADKTIDASGKWVVPGVIDDQVHFREPGLTHKAEIYTEAKAAVAGGTTSYMEMPNTIPQATTQEELAKKYARANDCSLANYSFFMGGTNDNIEEVLKTDPKTVCGVKLFMGSSTGDMLVDNEDTLRGIFSQTPMLIATHCEDEETIRRNTAKFVAKYGEDIPMEAHPIIRDEEACYLSSKMASDLAREYNARLHILHISTAKEIALFTNAIPLSQKRITAEVCVHHLSFNDTHYAQKGSLIKCNPAIKSEADQNALWHALNNDYFDIIATDHAPHTWEEKQNKYTKAPSGLPLVQHSLQLMLEHAKTGKITVNKVIEKMCHAPADLFGIQKRGYLREGYYADIVILNPETQETISKNNILYKCGWSPLEGETFTTTIEQTIVSGHLAYSFGKFDETKKGERLVFNP
ncbi:MAG TPA: dihydroorotase [Bacteroidetes bacterium]|jgi:dihydroorotase|nr:dihydroorotase [Bacteroidota bacterium]